MSQFQQEYYFLRLLNNESIKIIIDIAVKKNLIIHQVLGDLMKKKLLFILAVFDLKESPQFGDIGTLYYLSSIHFFPEYYFTYVHYPINNLRLQSPISGWQTLKVYDVLGNEVATLVDEYKTAGNYEVEFLHNGGLASSVYFYQIIASKFRETKKMILLR